MKRGERPEMSEREEGDFGALVMAVAGKGLGKIFRVCFSLIGAVSA